MWVTPITTCQNFQCQRQTYSATDSLFIYWIESVKKQDTPQFIHLTETSAACGRTKQPRQPHLPLMLGHTLLWDCILFFNQYLWQGSQCGCVGYSGRTSTLHADATSIQLRWQQDCWHALHTYILDLVSDKLHSVWVKRLGERRLFPDCGDMDCHWLQKLILISSSTEITSDEKLCFFTEGDAALHRHTASTKSFHRIGA